MKAAWGIGILLAGLMGLMFVSVAIGKPRSLVGAERERLTQCKAASQTFFSNSGYSLKFYEKISDIDTDACMFAGSGSADCGMASGGFAQEESSPDEGRCAAIAFKLGQPFVYREIVAGVDTQRLSWIILAPDLRLYVRSIDFFPGLDPIIEFVECSEPQVQNAPYVDYPFLSFGCKDRKTLEGPFWFWY